MKFKIVGIIDVNSIIKPSNQNAFQRHVSYAEELTNLNPRYKLAIFSNSSETFEQKSESFIFFPFGGRYLSHLVFFVKTFKQIRNNPPELLVAGDPWLSFLFSYLFSLTHFPHIPIQVQLHADVSDPCWYKLSWKNRIKRIFCKLYLKKANEIRFVTNSQRELVTRDINLGNSRQFVAAVPLNLSKSNFYRDRKKKLNSVGFVGRIDRDRGLGILLKVLRELGTCENPPRLVLVGEGEKRDYLLEQIQTFAPQILVEYLGLLRDSEMETAWSKIDVLISTAQSESYGRAIREALVCGIPVLALSSNGVIELSEKVDTPYLQIFHQKSICEIASKVRISQNTLVPKKIARSLILESNNNRKKIVYSWDKWLRN